MANTIFNTLTEEEVNKVAKQIGRDQNNVVSTNDFVDKEVLYNSLIETVKKYHPSDNTDIIEKSYRIADDAHKGQKRKSGEDYIVHPLSVALILADLEMDKETIVAGMLHDVVEDTVMTLDEIEEEFGEEVAVLVDGVTKLGQLNYSSDKVEVQAENLRKMFLAMAKDIRVIIIKLADRLHNMRTLQFMTPDKQREKAKETMEIYAPLAQRLGISKIKIELDDLSLKYYNPAAYREIVETIAQKKAERDAYVDNLVVEVQGYIDNAGIEAEIYGRAKHIFSIYRKMVSQNKEFDEIYDLFAVRIIVNSLQDCYAALGVIHDKYTPIPGRFKDYIAMPKPNMYQSLHTTVIGPHGVPFEIQIRTWEMHRTSEYGIAAHWKYKESGEGATVKGEEEKISWLRDILDWQKDLDDNKEFVSLLKNDLNLFSDTVFCFTPQGDVKNFPSGSTPIDFAYSIHSAVGNKMIGAKINGRLVPLEYELQNGDRVEILTSANSRGPSRDWLKVAKSTQARNKINQWFKNEFKVENIVRGKELLIDSAKQKSINFNDINKPEYQENVMRRYGFHDWESALAAIGHGGLNEGQVVSRMYEQYLKDFDNVVTDEDILNIDDHKNPSGVRTRKEETKGSNGVIVRGMDGFYARFSKCCNPVPGDEIVGFVTRGRGLSIHRTDCVNVINMPEIDRGRLLEAEWSEEYLMGEENALYMASVNIYVQSRVGLLVEISKIFSEADINIVSIFSNTNKKDVATITVGFEVKTRQMLENVCTKLRTIEGVIDIERTSG